MTDAYHAASTLEAESALRALAKVLDRTHPGAAASLREGLDERLTVLRLGVPPTLARTLRSTSAMVDDLRLPRARRQRQAMAGPADGAALGGAQPERPKPASNSVASTATCTCRHCAPRSSVSSPNLSDPIVHNEHVHAA